LKSVLQDSVHGSAWISLRALDVLRHRAEELAAEGATNEQTREQIADLARQLAVARPPMVSVSNRVKHFMELAEDVDREAEGGLAGRLSVLAANLRADAEDREERAAAQAAELVSGKCVFTLSRSATVVAALRQADQPPRVIVAESLPGGEGRGVAQELSAEGLDVTLVPDSAMATVLSSEWKQTVDLVLVGADTVTLEGDVVNKTGTRLAALAAFSADIPRYAVLTTDKISKDSRLLLEDPGAHRAASGSQPKLVEPVFELTPASLWTGLVTEDGLEEFE